jgi:hypothetical protein
VSIQTVTIGTSVIEVYGGTAAQMAYLAGSLTDGAVAFAALTPTQQAQTLVMASRYLDMQAWQGTPTGVVGPDPTTLQWPRNNVINADGSTLDSTTVPQALLNAVFEMCALIANDNNITTYLDQSTNTRQVRAGSASVEYFNPTSRLSGTATLLPPIVTTLVGQWLAGATGDTSWQAQGGYCTTEVARWRDLDLLRWPW